MDGWTRGDIADEFGWTAETAESATARWMISGMVDETDGRYDPTQVRAARLADLRELGDQAKVCRPRREVTPCRPGWIIDPGSGWSPLL